MELQLFERDHPDVEPPDPISGSRFYRERGNVARTYLAQLPGGNPDAIRSFHRVLSTGVVIFYPAKCEIIPMSEGDCVFRRPADEAEDRTCVFTNRREEHLIEIDLLWEVVIPAEDLIVAAYPAFNRWESTAIEPIPFMHAASLDEEERVALSMKAIAHDVTVVSTLTPAVQLVLLERPAATVETIVDPQARPTWIN